MSNNLPLGAENDPRAPWNEPEPKLIDLEVEITATVTKQIRVRIEEGYTNHQLYNTLREYADTQFFKESNAWEVLDVDYEMIK